MIVDSLALGKEKVITMDRKKVLTFLDDLKIEYTMIEHEPAVNAEITAYVDENLPSLPLKNLFLVNRQETEFYLLMMPREKDFRTKYIKQQLGFAHLSFAKEEHMVEKLDVHPGSVSVMCLINDSAENVHLILDADVIKCETVRFHIGDNTCSAKVKTDDFLTKILPALNREPIPIDIPWQEN